MALTTLSVKTTFNRVTGKIIIEDTTDYSGQGVDVTTANLEGYLSISYDIGGGNVVIYNNIGGSTPDITPATSLVSVADIDIPLSNDNTPLPAEYTVTYNVISGTLPADVTDAFQYTYSLTDTTISIASKVDCLSSSITSDDDTNYDVDGVTISALTRAHTLFPPPASGLAVMGPLDLKTLVYSPIATTTWSSEVVTTVTYIQGDSLNITVQYSGSKEFAATCDVNLSKIVCCLVGIDNEYEALECKNPTKAAIFKTNTIDPTMRHLTLFLAAQSAGNYDKMTSEYQKILDASHCTEDCGCNSSQPTIVQILGSGGGGGGGSIYVVDSPSNNISVTSEVVGNTTTYHLNLSSALLTAISNIRQYTASTTTPAYINVTTTSGNPTNFRVNWVGGALPVGGVQRLFIGMIKNNSTPTPYYNAASAIINNYGNGLNTTNTIFVGSAVGASSEVALIQITGFLNNTIYPNGTLLNTHVTLNAKSNSVPSFTDNVNLGVEMLWYDKLDPYGKIILRFVNPVTGNPYTLGDLDGIVGSTDYILVSLTISVDQ